MQAVLDVDEAAGRAVLEEPSGAEPSAPLSPRARAEVADALAALHAAGIVHGAVDRAHLRLAPGRVTLLLPEAPGAGSPDADREALARL